jgi:hypothetical protein
VRDVNGDKRADERLCHRPEQAVGSLHEVTDFRLAMAKRPRPNLLQGSTYRKETPLGTAYITVNSDEQERTLRGLPECGQSGQRSERGERGDGAADQPGAAHACSLPPSERLRWVMDEMAGIGGGRPLGFGANRVRSLPDGVAQVLAEHLSGAAAEPGRAVSGEQMALPLVTGPSATSAPTVAKQPSSMWKAAASAPSAATASARHGKEIRIKAYDWLARIFQHEIDHLHGVLMTDKAQKAYRLVKAEDGEIDAVPLDEIPDFHKLAQIA